MLVRLRLDLIAKLEKSVQFRKKSTDNQWFKTFCWCIYIHWVKCVVRIERESHKHFIVIYCEIFGRFRTHDENWRSRINVEMIGNTGYFNKPAVHVVRRTWVGWISSNGLSACKRCTEGIVWTQQAAHERLLHDLTCHLQVNEEKMLAINNSCT